LVRFAAQAPPPGTSARRQAPAGLLISIHLLGRGRADAGSAGAVRIIPAIAGMISAPRAAPRPPGARPNQRRGAKGRYPWREFR